MTYVTQAQPGEGVILQISIATVFTELALVTEFDGPAVMVAPVETTHLTSATHTYRPSKIPNPDKITGKMLFDPNDVSTQQLIVTRMTTSGLVDSFKIVFNDILTTHGTCAFSGFFTKLALTGIKVEENVEADFEIQITSALTFVAGS